MDEIDFNSNYIDGDGSSIINFYENKTIFLTGATGFLGKLLLEKLLRSCKISKIYILVRDKKAKTSKQRIEELFNIPMFELLRNEEPNFSDKVFTIIGDCEEPCLGLSDKDKQIIINEVNCIFHLAATVRFDAPLRKAAIVNVRCVKDLLEIAKEMKQLNSFVHVSTAYSNCIRKEIDEVFYESALSGEKILNVVEALDNELLDNITPHLLRGYPNTYAFTKGIAEGVIQTVGKGLPIAIVRPSIVIATSKEPVPGWIDNFYGATGVFFAVTMGLLRTMHAKSWLKADMVPADFVVNVMLAAAWNVRRENLEETERVGLNTDHTTDPPVIYNYVSGIHSITWAQSEELTKKHFFKMPSALNFWYPVFRMNSNKFVHELSVKLFHHLPAHTIDFIAQLMGKKPIMVNVYKRINKLIELLTFFTTREWDFKNENTETLFDKLSPIDKQLFNFNIKSIDWDDFFSTYTRGGRVYLLKDPLETIPQGRRKMYILTFAHYTLIAISCLTMCHTVKYLLGIINVDLFM